MHALLLNGRRRDRRAVVETIDQQPMGACPCTAGKDQRHRHCGVARYLSDNMRRGKDSHIHSGRTQHQTTDSVGYRNRLLDLPLLFSVQLGIIAEVFHLRPDYLAVELEGGLVEVLDPYR